MKSNKTCGGLVDFKENIIFEEYKDTPIGKKKNFKAKCLKKFGIEPSDNLYIRLVNYQIKKYDGQLGYGKHIEAISKYNLRLTKRQREIRGGNTSSAYRTQTLIDRIEKRLKDDSE